MPQNVGICLLVAESGLVKLRTRAHDLLLAVLCVYLQGRDERRNNVTLPVVGENRLMDVQCNTSPSSLVIGMIMIESRTYRIVAMNHRDTFKCLHFRLALFPCPHRQVPPSSSAICLSVSGQCLCAMRGSQALQWSPGTTAVRPLVHASRFSVWSHHCMPQPLRGGSGKDGRSLLLF